MSASSASRRFSCRPQRTAGRFFRTLLFLPFSFLLPSLLLFFILPLCFFQAGIAQAGVDAPVADIPANIPTDCPRIVSQSPYLTLALQWLERGECIVGVSRYDQELPELPRTGGVLDPDGEAIAALNPEWIISSNWASEETMTAVKPPEAELLRLDGFGSMRDAEDMLQTLARKTHAPADALAKIPVFAGQWREIAHEISRLPLPGRRLLVVSSCMGSPFSFGHQHLIGDIFTQAGFELVETAPKIRHLTEGQEIPDLDTLIDRFKPDFTVALSHESALYCRMIAPFARTTVISLDGASFVHPGAGLLRAYETIRDAFAEHLREQEHAPQISEKEQ